MRRLFAAAAAALVIVGCGPAETPPVAPTATQAAPAQPTVTARPPLTPADVTLNASDLPEAFEPLDDLDTIGDTPGLQVASAFAFSNGPVLVTGYSGLLTEEAVLGEEDPADLARSFLDAFGGASGDVDPLEVEVGQSSAGFSALVTLQEETQTRLDVIVFQQKDMLVLVAVFAPPGGDAAVEAETLATLLNARALRVETDNN